MIGRCDDRGGPVLVIGSGNTLRRDDGVGPRVAAAVAAWERPDVIALAVHQLLPELAEPLATARLAIFVDASIDAGEEPITLRLLEPSTSISSVGHTGDPRSLLALSDALYGRSPRAWSLALPIRDLSFGEGLTPVAEAGTRTALRLIAKLIDDETRHLPGTTREDEPCTRSR